MAGLAAKVREVCEMHMAKTHAIASQNFWKRAWKAQCIERVPAGFGKGWLETYRRLEYGNGELFSPDRVSLASPSRNEITR